MKASLVRMICLFLLCTMIILSSVACGNTQTESPTPSIDSSSDTTELVTEKLIPETTSAETAAEATEESIDTTETTAITESDDTAETESEPEQVIDEGKNALAMEEFGKVIRNEIKLYYPLRELSNHHETYLKDIAIADAAPTGQMLVDMDRDGVEEFLLSYTYGVVLLHYENGKVYGSDYRNGAMTTVYTDGSFYWWSNSDAFGIEYGISRLTFVDGRAKYEELCRSNNNHKFYLSGVQVSETQYNEYIESNPKVALYLSPFDTSFLDTNTKIAIELASTYWGINDGDFDAITGERYRITCTGKNDGGYIVILYRFIKNSYYEAIEEALVNIDTGEILTFDPNGKG